MSRIIRRTFTRHDEKDNNLNETLFHNANGYIGIRGALEEGVPNTWNTMRGSYINGFYDVIPMKQAENLCNFVDKKDTMVNLADCMSISCRICGEAFDMTRGRLLEHTRELNMDDGCTVRYVDWISEGDKHINIVSKRMASFDRLSLFSIEYTITAVDNDIDILLCSTHNADVRNYCDPGDPRLASESIRNMNVLEMEWNGEYSVEVSETSVSKLKMCSLVYNDFPYMKEEKVISKREIKDDCAYESFKFNLLKGQSVTLVKYCVYTDSLRFRDVKKAALEIIEEVREEGLSSLYIKQRNYLQKFWKQSGMEIYGDEEVNKSVSFNMYQLLQSAAKDSHCSIAAKGLSGEGYEGHYFWDTEIFVLPFLIMTNPFLAKKILNYRYRTLNEARKNAYLLGHQKGALYPWRTITGKECSGYFVSGSAAYHINADIAYAVIEYYLTTNDIKFIEEMGEEILIETARLWMDLGNYNPDGRFVLNEVTGPDEYTCMVDNNYYTNCAAKYNMEWAVKLFGILKEQGLHGSVQMKLGITDEELSEILEASERMLLPYDEKIGINPQDDSFLNKPMWDFDHTPAENYPLLLHYHPLHLYRYQVCKQADTVLSYFMFEKMQDYDVMCRSFEYYEKITTHDSSLSTCAFSIVASRLGMREKGYGYFGDSAKLDLKNTHNNTKDGIHTANMGGCYMAIVNGFAGLKIDEEGLHVAPFVPEEWDGYMFNVMYKGRLIRISSNKMVVTAELVEGETTDIFVYGQKYTLCEKAPIVADIPSDICAVKMQ